MQSVKHETYTTQILVVCAMLFLSASNWAYGDDTYTRLPAWQPGEFDIHHISTGRGDAVFFVFPDGTTMLFDAGDLDLRDISRFAPLKVADARPTSDVSSGAAISDYIRAAMPNGVEPRIDYAVVSHFHSDHFGHYDGNHPLSKFGDYRLSGIAEVAETVSIGIVVDRGYPDYGFPTDLRAYFETTEPNSFSNYLEFVESNVRRGRFDATMLIAGRSDQIVLKQPDKYPTFSVRNVKSSGSIWTGQGAESAVIVTAEQSLDENGRFNDNPLSLALAVSYGPFDYFTGGDNTGLEGFGLPDWFDVETPMGAAVGQVDVLSLNHHGNRDATNESFLAALAPRVIVQQSWISDHPGGEVLHRMASELIWPGPRDIFSTSMAQETKVAIGPWMTRAYASFEGHIVIRVDAGGEQYRVFVLDDRSSGQLVKSVHGPYRSN